MARPPSHPSISQFPGAVLAKILAAAFDRRAEALEVDVDGSISILDAITLLDDSGSFL